MSIRQRLLATGVTIVSLVTVLGATAALALTGTGSAAASGPPVAAADPTSSTLRELAARSALHIGTAVDTAALQNLRRFARLGVDTAITEADVRSILPMDSTKLQAQANGYSLLMESCLLTRNCISYTVWGFTDKYQWVPGVFEGQGAAALYDENYVPRPAFDALRRDLALGG